LKRYLDVRKSGVHGKGLFTKKDIPAGAVLGVCEVKKTEEMGDYSLWVSDDEIYEVLCHLKYINHSKQANVVYYDNMSVVTIADIKKDEELLHDYGEEWS